MNKKQKKEIEKICAELDNLLNRISEIKEQEQEKFDNLPENLQATEKNQLIEQAAENLEDAESDISDLIDKLNEIIEN